MAEITKQERLEVDDETADKLLNDDTDDANDNQPDPPVTGEKDWKAEAEKWRNLSRKNEKDFKTTAQKLAEYEDANKSEAQRLLDERDSHKTRAEKAEARLARLEIAQRVAPEHATFAQLQKVLKRMAGDDEEALEQDALELWADYAPEPAKPKTPTRPRERMRGGGEPETDDPDDTDDPRKLADRITGVRRT
jgi:hypothetical protein